MARPVRETLTKQQLDCIKELIQKDITGKTNEEIAEEIGINIATLYRWRRNKLFNDKLTELAEELQRSYLSDTYCQLRGIINNPKTTTNHKIKAIELMLKNQGRLKDSSSVSAEVTVNSDARGILERLGITSKQEDQE